jgi:hypothetical protein
MASAGCSEPLPIGNSGEASLAPTLRQMTPSLGACDRSVHVRLDGSGFTAASRIQLDGQQVPAVEVNPDGSLSAWFPDHAGVGGRVQVTVVSPDGQSTEPMEFYYFPRTVAFQGELYSTGGPLHAVAAGDLDGDRRTDLIIGPNDRPQLSLLYGRQAPRRLMGPVELPLSSSDVQAIAVWERADAAAAERILLAFTHPGLHTVEVVLGDGSKWWNSLRSRSFETGTYPTALIVTDLNQDSYADVVVTNTEDDDVSVLLGSPGASLLMPQRRYPVCSRPRALASGDLNQDGLLDLAITCSDTGQLRLLLGESGGTLRPGPLLAVGQSAYGVVIGDLNRDGQPDLIIADAAAAELVVLLGRAGMEFHATERYAVGKTPLAVVAVDLNGDGILDLASANYSDSTVSVLLGDGSGHLGPAQHFAVSQGPIGIVTGDFDGDDKMDLAVSGVQSALVTVLTNARP